MPTLGKKVLTWSCPCCLLCLTFIEHKKAPRTVYTTRSMCHQLIHTSFLSVQLLGPLISLFAVPQISCFSPLYAALQIFHNFPLMVAPQISHSSPVCSVLIYNENIPIQGNPHFRQLIHSSSNINVCARTI